MAVSLGVSNLQLLAGEKNKMKKIMIMINNKNELPAPPGRSPPPHMEKDEVRERSERLGGGPAG